MFQRLVEMKQELSKIMGNIVEILTCDPFPVVTKKQKNGNKERSNGGAETRSPSIQDT